MEPSDELRFSVKCAHNIAFMVDFTDNTCPCSEFQLETFSYEDTVAIAMYRGFAIRTLHFPYYTTDYWRTMYTETIFPLPNKVE